MGEVKAVAIPTAGLVATALDRVHYADAFALTVPRGTFGGVDRLAQAATRLSTGGKALMATRDLMVRPFGLVTATEQPPTRSDPPIVAGSVVGIFKVLARSSDEILMGLDDKHLDSRFSLILRTDVGVEQAIATTVVRFHNAGGRLYFAFVKPIHRLLVPAMLRKAAARARLQGL